MADTPDIPEIAPSPVPHVTLDTPTEVASTGLVAASPSPGVADTARLLAEHFPALFGAGPIKPIKLRIQADIDQQAPGIFTRKALSIFLQRYTTATAYLRALVAEGATRIDLAGQPSGEIAAEHRDAAVLELERRRAIVDAKKLAGREAARASRREARPQQAPPAPLPTDQAVKPQPAAQATGERPGVGDDRSPESTPSARQDRSPRRPRSGPAPGHTPSHRPVEQRGQRRTGDAGSAVPQSAHRPPHQPDRAGPREPDPVGRASLPMTREEAAERDARHQRALLLRSFEQSTLSKTNFGALKGLSEAALDGLLNLARQERDRR